MNYTPEQHDAITIQDRNVIVTAGAGSGKTRVLVDRYVALLDAHPDWPLPSLVAITFTEKAAREMRDRVRQAIEERIVRALDAQSNGGNEHEIRRWRDHQAALDSARIGTIHSLCTTILRANAAELGIDPRFEVLDEIESVIVRGDAVEQALVQLADQPAARLLAEYGRSVVSETLSVLVNLEDARLSMVDSPLERWRALHTQHAEALLSELSEDTEFLLALNWQPPCEDDTDKIMQSWQLVSAGRDVLYSDASPDEMLAVLMQWGSEIDLRGGKPTAWGGKESLELAKGMLRLIRERAQDAVATVGLFSEDDEKAAELVAFWYAAIVVAKRSYGALKAARRALDFNDLEYLTRRLLRNKAIAERYRASEFRHILIDEFQDTNEAQREIISALTGMERPGSLFVVGDPRQSIYGFRGADIRVFTQVREQILASGGNEINLSLSFRTHTRLVDSFSTIFQKLMVRSAGPVGEYEVELGQPMAAKRVSEAHHSPTLEIIQIDKEYARAHETSGEDLRRWEAWALAQRLRELVEGGWPIWDKQTGEYRALKYGDIAVLFQATRSMPQVEEVFKAVEIPYVTIAGKGYYNRPEVWDLNNLLKALYNRFDNLSLAAALRSPLFGLSDDDLFALRQQRDASGKRLPLWFALTRLDNVSQDLPHSPPPSPLRPIGMSHREGESRAAGVGARHASPLPNTAGEEGSDVNRYDPPLTNPEIVAFARESLLRLHAIAGRVTLAELLARVLDETGLLATLSGLPNGEQRCANVEKLIDLARRSGRLSLGDFTTYMQDLSDREAREGEALIEVEDAVQLMTIHASKGLEFPVVALFDASWERRERGEAFFVDPALGPVCCIVNDEGGRVEPFAFRLAKRYRIQREAAERTRLLYVGMTRAQDYVIISGHVGSKSGEESWLHQITGALDLDPESMIDAGQDHQLIQFDWGDVLLRVPRTQPRLEQLIARSGQAATLWDQLGAEPVPDTESIEPPLLAAIRFDRSAPGRMLTATEIAIFGEGQVTGNTDNFRSHVLRDAPREIRDVAEIGTPSGISPRIIGEIVHRALRWWRLPGNTPDLASVLGSYAWEEGIADPQMLDLAVNEAIDLLRRTEASSIAQRIEQAQKTGQVYRELPFTYQLGERTISGVIDVLFFLRQQWHVVDYKTGIVSPEDGETLWERLMEHSRRYHAQVGIYAGAVEGMTGQTPDVHLHYIRYVRTIHVQPEVWQPILAALDTDIETALTEGA